MMKIKRGRFALASLAFAQSAAIAQTAQDAPSSEPRIDQVVVTATKLDKSLGELTQSVTVITEDELQSKAYADFTEALRARAGIEFKQAGGPGQFNYPKMRGFGTSDILVVIDGVKVNEASSGGVGNLLGQIDPSTIERVEVLRGPQAVLYGADSTAGVISITTKDGQTQNGSVQLEAGSLRWRRGSLSLRDTLKPEGGDGAFSYSLNASKVDSDNVNPLEYTRNDTVQGKLAYDREAFGAGLTFWQTDNVFQYAELDEAPCCQTRDTYWAFQTPDPHQITGTKETVLGAHIRHRISDRWKQRFQVGSMEETYTVRDPNDGLLGFQPAPRDDFVFDGNTYARNAPVPIYDGPGDTAAFYADKNTQLDYNLIFEAERGKALFGAEYLDQNARQWGSYGTADNDESVASFYGSGEFDVTRRFILSLGMRSDDFESWGRKTTGNVGAAFDFGSRTTLFANLGTSFTAPTMSQLFNPVYGVTDLNPQSGKTSELGVRLTDRRVKLEATLWHSELDDVIIYDGLAVNPRSSSGFGQYANRDVERTQGLELAVSYQLTDTLALSGNYTYTESASKALGGDWIPTVQIAKNKGNIGLSYRNGRFHAGANAYYAGPRLRWAGDVAMKEYVRVDVSGGVDFTDTLSAYIRIENLFDEDTEEALGYKEPGIYSIIGLRYKLF